MTKHLTAGGLVKDGRSTFTHTYCGILSNVKGGTATLMVEDVTCSRCLVQAGYCGTGCVSCGTAKESSNA